MRILIADDCEPIRRALKRELAGFGDIIEAVDAAEALERLDEVDAVVTDWDMPNGGGRRVIEACAEAGKPVVLHSGNVDVDPKPRFHVMKGSSRETLRAAVAAAIGLVDKST